MAKGAGRVSPNNIQAEQSVLCCMMISETARAKGLSILKARDFYRPPHQVIFKAMETLASRNQPVDIITISALLKDLGKLEEVGGVEYLTNLSEVEITAANMDMYARIVEEKSVRRHAIETCTEVVSRLYEDMDTPLDDLRPLCEQQVLKAFRRRNSPDIVKLGDVEMDLVSNLDSIIANPGLPIHLAPLARACIAFRNGNLIVIAARTGVGKTILANQLVTDIAVNDGHPVGIISCEMTEEDTAWRELARRSGVGLYPIFTNRIKDFHKEKLQKAAETHKDHPIYFVKAVGKTIEDIASVTRRLVAEYGVKIIVIDHFGRVAPSSSRVSRREQMEHIANNAKDLGMDLEIPVIGLCQMTREYEKQAREAEDKGKILLPSKAHIMESGAVEAAADAIILPWREMPTSGKRLPKVTKGYCVIDKNRQFPTMTVEVGFDGESFRFVEPAPENMEDPKANNRSQQTSFSEDYS